MIPILKKLPVFCAIFMLAGCGGGGSSQLIVPTVTLTQPPVTTIAAGATLQLSATVTNSSNTTVLWFVDGQPGGSSAAGTISPQGLYIAPTLPPSNGTVVISAAAQAFPVAVASVIIGVTFGAGSLNGNYVFTLNGTQANSPWAVTGSFTANGDGIINGIEDINGPAGIAQALPFSGSYIMDSNGQGTATFTSSQGSVTLVLTLNAQGQAVLMRTDAGSVATGFFYPQLSTALTLTNLNSPYVFNFSGVDQSGKLLNSVGTFVTNGTNTLASAEEDLNDGGTASNQSFSGIYSIGSNGRGTATFNDSTGARVYSFYIVSPTQLEFIETDTSGHLSGTVFQQQSVITTTTLAGGYVFYVSGSNGTAVYGAAGGFGTNTAIGGEISAGTDDINNDGSISTNATLTGSFTIGNSGRGTITLAGADGTTDYVYYLITPNTGFLLTTDAGINASGQLFFQTGGFSTAALTGNYSLMLASPAGATSPSSMVGLIDLNGGGSLAGLEAANSNGTISDNLAVTGTYAITASTTTTSTRGVATLTTNGGASTNFAVYPISGSSVILLGESGLPVVGTLVSQY